MTFKLDTVESCPVTRASRGVITMAPELVGMIAGAVRDKIEWIVLLGGTRSTDGYEVLVKEFIIPKQYRGGSHADLIEMDLPDGVVGVMHSHHTMGAFFSSTDKNDLNPRFPSSIVVAIADSSLGFSYEAEGKVLLPCGAIGRAKFALAVEGVDHFAAVPVRAQHKQDEETDSIAGCMHWSETERSSTEYQVVKERLAACGLRDVVTRDRPSVFGQDGAAMLAQIEAHTEKRTYTYTTVGKDSAKAGTKSGVNRVLRSYGSCKRGKSYRKGRYSARREGLVGRKLGRKLDYSAATGVYKETWCEGSCEPVTTGFLKQHPELDMFLCHACYEAIDDELRRLDASVEDSSTEEVILTEDNVRFVITDDELIIDEYDGQWGV